MTATKTSRATVRLTTQALSTDAGIALLERLENVWADGVISTDDVADIAAWLDAAMAAGNEIPGVHFLREEVSGILADGIVTEPEKRLLRDAILRVLPTTERERARARFAEAADLAREARKKDREVREREELIAASYATAAQIEYVRNLGGECPEGTSKADASALIDSLLEGRPSVRQRMVLRFWNRLDLSQAGVDGVSRWMDEWYAEDPDRSEAWTLWKSESGDRGQREPGSIEHVPLGGGDEYLARVKARRAPSAATAPTPQLPTVDAVSSNGSQQARWLLVFLVLLAGLGLVLVLLLR